MAFCPACGVATADGRPCRVCGAKMGGTSSTPGGGQASPVEAPMQEMESRPTKPAGFLVGSYRILDLIGTGGMGHVYLAEHVRLGRKVAMKMLKSELAGQGEAVNRFFAEARAVNKIAHEHIVEITDFIEQPGEDNYYIMELLQGGDLEQLLERAGTTRLSLARATGIAIQVCSALTAVHAAGMIHRDLKPANVFLAERGGRKDFVKLLDFGVAKLLGVDGAVPLNSTASGSVIGTPEYMSPEQAAGKVVDYRSDIYSLGVILYRMVTGKLPIEGRNFGEIVVKLMTLKAARATRHNPEIPGPLADLIAACLAREPEERPQGTAELEASLRKLAADHGWDVERFAGPGTQSLPKPFVPSRSRARWPFVAGALAAIGVGIGVLTFGRPDDPPPARLAIPPGPAETAAPAPPPAPPAQPAAIAAPDAGVRAPAADKAVPRKKPKKRPAATAKPTPYDRRGVLDPFGK